MKIGIVSLVGLSAGSIAFHGDASFESIVAITVGGSFVGAALVWFLFPDIDAIAPAETRRYRRGR